MLCLSKVTIFVVFCANFFVAILIPCDVISETHFHHILIVKNVIAKKNAVLLAVLTWLRQYLKILKVYLCICFQKEETYSQRRRKWISFVRKHRPYFTPTSNSCLCSAHFEKSSYDGSLSLAKSLNLKRLKKDAFFFSRCFGDHSRSWKQRTDGERRQVREQCFSGFQ